MVLRSGTILQWAMEVPTVSRRAQATSKHKKPKATPPPSKKSSKQPKVKKGVLRELQLTEEQMTPQIDDELEISAQTVEEEEAVSARVWAATNVSGQELLMPYTAETNAIHKRLLQEIHDRMDELETTDVVLAIASYLINRRNNPRTTTDTGLLKWATMKTIAGNIIGAMKAPQIHGSLLLPMPDLAKDPRYARMLTSIKANMSMEDPLQAPPR